MSDWRDDEFQRLLDLTPVKVKVKPAVKPSTVPEETASVVPPRDTSALLSFFSLPAAKKLDPGLVGDLTTIGRMIRGETEDADEFFMILQAVEKSLPALDDPVLRVERMARQLRAIRQEGRIKDVLLRQGVLRIDDAEQHALESGKWGRFLKLSKQREQAVTP